MIIDSHAHLHPSQADLEDWDFDGTEAALRHQQRILYAYHHPQAVTGSGETVKDAWKLLWDARQPYSWAGTAGRALPHRAGAVCLGEGPGDLLRAGPVRRPTRRA